MNERREFQMSMSRRGECAASSGAERAELPGADR
jgi:hypothetical protein